MVFTTPVTGTPSGGGNAPFSGAVTKSGNTPSETNPTIGAYTGRYRMDVVPYISKISTTIRKKSGLKDNNIRSASGRYSIMYAGGTDTTTYPTYDAQFITVNGFNLNPNYVRIIKSADLTTAGTGTGISATYNNVAADRTSFYLRNTINNSGYLEVFTNGIRSLNNVNNNDSYGSVTNNSGTQLTSSNATVSDYTSSYNREPDYYSTKNVQLTDDRYLILWDMKKTNTKNGFYPVMVMEGNDPVFGFVDSTGRHADDSTISMTVPTDMQPQRRKFSADGSYTTGNTEYLVSGSTWEQMAMARDDGGKYHQVSVYNRTTGSMGYFYQSYAKLHTTDSGYDGRQMGYGYSDYYPNTSQTGNNNALTLDGMNYGGLLVDRYQNIKLIAKGDSTTTTGATIYQAYLDDSTGELVFRDFKVATKTMTLQSNNVQFAYNASITTYPYNNNTSNGTARNVYTITGNTNYNESYVEISGEYYKLTRTGYYTRRATTQSYYYTVEGYNGNATFTSNVYTGTAPNGWNSMFGNYCTNLTENTSNTAVAQGRNQVTSSGSKFYDFGVAGNRVVFVYYDLEQGRLRLMYSSADVTGNPATAVSFSENGIHLPDYVGQYVSMAIDSNGGIHIAAFDANDSDLKYFYLTSYNASTFTEMTVDAAGSVGNWTSIKIDESDSSHPYYRIPVIAYYNSTESGGRETIKLAYANEQIGNITAGIDTSSGYTSTGWEYMTIPSIDPAQGSNQKFQQVCLDFDSNGIPVVGYLGTNLEFGKQRPE